MSELDEAPPEDVPSRARQLGFGFWLSIGWILLVTFLAVFAGVLPISDPDQIGVGDRFESPRSGLWFGGDALGKDVFALTIWGGRISLLVGFLAIVIGFVVGGTFGILAGFFRGWFDRGISFVFATLLSFPALLLAILITDLMGRTVGWISLSLGILAIAPVGRLARAQTLVFAEREFVTAARVLGASNRRIIIKELLPNVVIPMSALALLGMGVAIVAEGTLAFLGISVPDGSTLNLGLFEIDFQGSWGTQIQQSGTATGLQNGAHAALFPIGVVTITVLALNYAGDRLREVLDAKELAL